MEWLTNLWDWFTACLLHPMVSLQQVPVDQLSDWDDPNFLVQRMAFPELWLPPLVNVDYIKALPTWNFSAIHQQSRKELRAEETDSVQVCEEQDFMPEDHIRQINISEEGGSSICTNSLPNQKRRNSDGNDSLNNLQKNSNDQISNLNNTCECGCDGDLTVTCCREEGPLGSRGREDAPGPGPPRCDWSVWPPGTIHCLECVVCLENFFCEELLMHLPCGHAFHQQCIVVWLVGSRHCCPVCRWPSYKNKPPTQTALAED